MTDLPDFSLLSHLVLTIFNNFQLLENRGDILNVATCISLSKPCSAEQEWYHTALPLSSPAVFLNGTGTQHLLLSHVPLLKGSTTIQLRWGKLRYRSWQLSASGPCIILSLVLCQPRCTADVCLPGAARCWVCLLQRLFQTPVTVRLLSKPERKEGGSANQSSLWKKFHEKFHKADEKEAEDEVCFCCCCWSYKKSPGLNLWVYFGNSVVHFSSWIKLLSSVISGKSMKMWQFALADEMAWDTTCNAEWELCLLTKSCQHCIVLQDSLHVT